MGGRAGKFWSWVCAWACVVVCVWPSRAHALDDPMLEYFTITTEHFHVHYFTGLEDLARKVAVTSEEAHEIIAPLLDWNPAGRTHVMVADKLDTANGFAQVFGRNFFTVYGMPPESDSVLGYYDDWIRILVYHEYVHIVHLDTTHGLPHLVNTVIGKQWNPNQILPRWLIEGMATYYESARTGTGRVNSSLYGMWRRAELLGPKTAFDLGQISHAPRRWPFGSTAYLFGSFFVEYLARTFGEDTLTDFSHIYGGRLIPYSMNQAFKEATGSTFEAEWPAFMAESHGRAIARKVAVQAAGRTPLEPVTTKGGESKFPRVNPATGEVVFYHADFDTHPVYAKATPDGGIERLFEVDAAYGAAGWSPDGEHLVFSRTTIDINVYRYSDLFKWTARTGKVTQLTRSERAREPALSPDGRAIAYVRNRAGTMELVVRRVEEAGPAGPARVLVGGTRWRWDNPRHWQQIATPVWSPDGRSLVFSWWREDVRTRDLWRYDFDAPEGQRLRALTRDGAMDLDPSFGPDGLLYFSSDRTGIYNVYAMDVARGDVWQVSNVLMGVFSPRVTKDGKYVYVTTYGQRGYDVARFELDTKSFTPAAASTINPAWRKYPAIDTSAWTDTGYDANLWLAPLTFIPDLAAISSGLGFAGSLEGYDPAGRHYYGLNAGLFTSVSGEVRPLASLVYVYGGLPVDLRLTGSYREFTRTRSLFVDDEAVPFPERRIFGAARLSYPIRTIDDGLTIALTYQVDQRSFAQIPRLEFEPGSLEPIPPELGMFNELRLSLGYDDVEQFPYSVTIERGVSADLSLSIQDPALGSDYESLQVTYGLFFYWPVPLFDGHVVRLASSGGFIETNFRARSTYSIGGLAQQNVLQAIVTAAPGGGSRVRGYDPFVQSGNQYFTGSLEYRLPVLDIEQGFSSAPLFLRQLKARAFLDTGAAFNGFLADAEPIAGVGAELQLEMIFGYYLFGNLRLGYAYGLDPELGKHDLYVLYGGGF